MRLSGRDGGYTQPGAGQRGSTQQHLPPDPDGDGQRAGSLPGLSVQQAHSRHPPSDGGAIRGPVCGPGGHPGGQRHQRAASVHSAHRAVRFEDHGGQSG